MASLAADTVYPADFVTETTMLEHDLSVAPGRTHMYFTGTSVVPFGFGLSLTSWKLNQCPTAPISIQTDDSTAHHNVTLTVENAGGTARGDIVVMAFLLPVDVPSQTGSKLKQKLWAFERVADVLPGSTVPVTFAATADALALFDVNTGAIVSAPGKYQLKFTDGSGTPAGECTVDLTITGPLHVLEPFPTAL
jgi:hypothetical protein